MVTRGGWQGDLMAQPQGGLSPSSRGGPSSSPGLCIWLQQLRRISTGASRQFSIVESLSPEGQRLIYAEDLTGPCRLELSQGWVSPSWYRTKSS